VVVKSLAVLSGASCSNIRDIVKATLGEHLNSALRHIKDSRILVDPLPNSDVQSPSSLKGGVQRLNVSRRGSIDPSTSSKPEHQKDHKSLNGSDWGLDKHQPLSPDAVQRFAARTTNSSSGVEATRQEAQPKESSEAGAAPSVAERSRPKGALYMRSLSVMQRNGTTKPRGTMETRLAAIAKARADAAYMSHVDLEATARTDRSRTIERSRGKHTSPSGQAQSEPQPLYCPWRATSHDAALVAKRAAWARTWAERLYSEEEQPVSSRPADFRQRQPIYHSRATIPWAPAAQSLPRGRTPSAPRSRSESRTPVGGGVGVDAASGVQRAYLGLHRQAPRASASTGPYHPDSNSKPWERSPERPNTFRSVSTGRMPDPNWWSPPPEAPRLYKRVAVVRRRRGPASAPAAASAAPSTSPLGAAPNMGKPAAAFGRPASAAPVTSTFASPPHGVRPHTSPVTVDEGSRRLSNDLAGESGQLNAKKNPSEAHAPVAMGTQAPPAIRSSLSSSRSTSRERSHSGVRFSEAPVVHTTVAPVHAPASSSSSNEAPQVSTENATFLPVSDAVSAPSEKVTEEIASALSASTMAGVCFAEQPPVVSKARASLAKSLFKQEIDTEEGDNQNSQPPAAFRSETMALFGKEKARATPAAEKPVVLEEPAVEEPSAGASEDEEGLAGMKGMIHKLSTNQMTPSKATYSNASKKASAQATRAEEKASLRAEAAAFTKADTQAMNDQRLAVAEAKSIGDDALNATGAAKASISADEPVVVADPSEPQSSE